MEKLSNIENSLASLQLAKEFIEEGNLGLAIEFMKASSSYLQDEIYEDYNTCKPTQH